MARRTFPLLPSAVLTRPDSEFVSRELRTTRHEASAVLGRGFLLPATPVLAGFPVLMPWLGKWSPAPFPAHLHPESSLFSVHPSGSRRIGSLFLLFFLTTRCESIMPNGGVSNSHYVSNAPNTSRCASQSDGNSWFFSQRQRQRQRLWLPTGEDGLHVGRRQQRQPKQFPDRGRIQTLLTGNVRPACHDALVEQPLPVDCSRESKSTRCSCSVYDVLCGGTGYARLPRTHANQQREHRERGGRCQGRAKPGVAHS